MLSEQKAEPTPEQPEAEQPKPRRRPNMPLMLALLAAVTMIPQPHLTRVAHPE